MAEYLIQGGTLTDIANQIRSRTGSNNLISPTDMGSQVQLVYAKGYTNGKLSITDGEKRDETNVTDSVDVESRSVDVDIESGYYAKGILRTVDVNSVYNAGMANGAEQGYSYGYEDGHTEGYNDGYIDGYDDGYAVGFEAGSAGGVADPTTVWELPSALGINTSFLPVTIAFNSAGIDFVGIQGGALSWDYVKSDGSTVRVYSKGKWSNEAYRTITVLEEIPEGDFLDWLNSNATLISSGGGGESSEDLEALGALCEWMVSTDSESMATVTICNYHPSYFLHCNVWAEYSDVSFVNVIISPDSCGSVMFTDYTFSTINPIYVENVRWTKRGTA